LYSFFPPLESIKYYTLYIKGKKEKGQKQQLIEAFPDVSLNYGMRIILLHNEKYSEFYMLFKDCQVYIRIWDILSLKEMLSS